MAELDDIPPFVPDSVESIRTQILDDLSYESIRTVGVQPAIQPGQDDYNWANADAHALFLAYSNLSQARSALTPLDASGESLEEWRISLGLPEVEPSAASGRIRIETTGSATVADGTQLQLPNGLEGAVVGTHVGVTSGSEITATAISIGSATNLDADTVVKFISPPLNVKEEATVSRNDPFTGGYDEETDERKRVRIANEVGNKPAGGNWAHHRKIVLDTLQSAQDCYVYPALGGPASVKVVPVRDYDPNRSEYTRAMNSIALDVLRNAIYAEMPDQSETVVEAAADETVDVALAVEIPDAALVGGNGQGWLDAVPWPQLEVSDGGFTSVSSVVSSKEIVIDADTATAPIAGQTRIAWWSPVDRKFRVYLIVSVTSAVAGAWQVVLDRPLVASDGTAVAAGDYISPAAVKSEDYGKSWVEIMRRLGPGENTSDVNRLPRALRHPYAASESPSSLNFAALKTITSSHSEMTEASYGYRSLTSPTVPASVADPPNIFVIRHFGIYKI